MSNNPAKRLLPDRVQAEIMVADLTVREKELVQHLANGRTAQEICTVMHIGYGTYKAHKNNIKRKLNNLPAWGWPAIWFLAEGLDNG